MKNVFFIMILLLGVTRTIVSMDDGIPKYRTAEGKEFSEMTIVLGYATQINRLSTGDVLCTRGFSNPVKIELEVEGVQLGGEQTDEEFLAAARQVGDIRYIIYRKK